MTKPNHEKAGQKVWPIENIYHTTQTNVAMVFGIKRQSVGEWKDMPRNSDGTVSLPDVVQWKFEQATLASGTSAQSENLERWRAAQADIKELELAKMRGELAEVAQVNAEISRMVITFRQALQALPASVASRLEGLEAREIAPVLAGEVERILRDLKGGE